MVDSLHGAGIECLMEFYFDGSVGSSQILDILHYWMKTYHIDGFHLMGKGVLPEVLVKDKWLSQSKLFFLILMQSRFIKNRFRLFGILQSTMRDFYIVCVIF